jgi:CheY-like chemotaxis protein
MVAARVQSPVRAASIHGPGGEVMAATRPVVLVVDDEESAIQLVQAVLEPEGYVVEGAADGATALARLAAGQIDLVILDVMLPDVDGRELCARIRAQVSPVYRPIIMLTALAAASDRHAGFSAGADDYLSKPFRLEDLVDRVRVWARVREYLKSHPPQREETVGDPSLLETALATSHDLTRLLVLLLGVLEGWETAQPSPEDFRRFRTQFHDAAAVIASRINLLSRQASAANESPRP